MNKSKKTLPALNESAMESGLRKLKDLAERFEQFKAGNELHTTERQKELGLLQAEFSHILMLAINWDTLAQMDPTGLSAILEVIPVGTWTAVFKRLEAQHLRRLLMGLSDADMNIVTEILRAVTPERLALILSNERDLSPKLLKAVEEAKSKW